MSIKSFLSSKNSRVFFPILLLSVSLLAYLNTLHHQFVFDDFKVIVNNPFIRDWKYLPTLFNSDYFKTSGELSYRPLVTLSYFIDYAIWSLNPFGFHLTNLLIHTLNGYLVFFVIFKVCNDLKIAGISCLFFCAHPLLTETVNSVGFREDLLCATFFLIAILFYIKIHTSKYKNTCYISSLLAYFFSLFSKEMAISLPLIIFVFDLIFPQSKIHLKTRILRYHSGFIFLSGIYLFLRLILFKNTIEHVSYPGNSMIINALTMTKVVASYIKLWFFPIILNPDYHVTFETNTIKLSFILSVALLICVVLITFRLHHKQKGITFSILWTFLTLIPVINIIPIGNIMAERYLYIPSLGFCLFLGILIVRTNACSTHAYRIIGKTCLIIMPILYLTHTIRHNRVWLDKQTLWSYTVYHTSCSFNAHNNLGKEYFLNGLIDKAIEEYTIALSKASEVQYKYPSAHYNLGLAFDTKGMYDASIREYKNALRIDPKSADTHNNLGITFYKIGQVNKAIEELNTATILDPNNSIYHHNLAKLYNEINMPEKAKTEYDLANRLKTNEGAPY